MEAKGNRNKIFKGVKEEKNVTPECYKHKILFKIM